jgi:pimeloyl-ACP methyl ester carboxylesterase
MSAWESRFVDVDGIRTHVLEAGEGRPVVLLHAGEYGGSSELSWEHTIPALAQRYRVIAPDWLGFGETDKVHDFVSGAGRRMQHMTRLLEQLEIGPAAYVGNSMGGALLARAMGSDDPPWDAEALVVVSAGGFAPDNEHRRTLLNYDATVEGMRAILRVLFHDERFAADDAYVRRRYASSIVPGAWECASAARLRSPVLEARPDFGVPDPTQWELLAVPTLLVGGAQDKLKVPGYVEEIVPRLREGRGIVYDDCGHAPNIECAERFNADVLAFLLDVYPPTADPAIPSDRHVASR